MAMTAGTSSAVASSRAMAGLALPSASASRAHSGSLRQASRVALQPGAPHGRPVATRSQAETPVEASTAEADAAAPTPAADGGSGIRAPEGFVAPEPRRFTVAQGQLLDIATAAVPALMRLGTGAFVTSYKASLQPAGSAAAEAKDQYKLGPVLGRVLVETSSYSKRPAQPIILYEFEGCPFCRKVREAVSALDVDVLFYPTPQNGPNFRPKAIQLGGKRQFPYMIDPNTGVSMYESNDIIKYLADTYGDGTVPLMLRLGLLTDITAGLANLGRLAKGSRYVPARQPPQPLELWAYEVSPFCKVVREALCELELPHVYHSTARGSAKRDELIARTGRFQVPYLEDPNTGVSMFESKAIVDYLYKTYALDTAKPATA